MNTNQHKPNTGKDRISESRYGELKKKFDHALKQHKSGKLQRAKQQYENILDIAPEHNDALHMLGLLSHQLGDNDIAIQLLNKALDNNKNSPELFTNLGNALQTVGRLDEAIAAFEQAIKINPDFALAYNNLGNALVAAENNDAAVAALQKAVNLAPQYPMAHFNLGNALHARGEHDKSVASYRTAITLNPDYIDAIINLASVLIDNGETAAAAPLFNRALQLDSNNAMAVHMLAAIEGKTTESAPPEYVARLFDDMAETYDQHLVDKLEYRVPQYLLDAVTDITDQQSLNVLDLGCGTGLCGPLFRDLANHLTGVDLSPGMLARAEAREVYDELIPGDITKTLLAEKAVYGLILAADVLIYIGDLKRVFAAAGKALRPGGLFAFSIEACENEGEYILRSTGRYAHSIGYIKELTTNAGLRALRFDKKILRMDKTDPVDGYICVLEKSR